jgi:hypothetical protein
MKKAIYIIIIVVVLIGSALLFRLWALDNFNLALSGLDKENTSVYISKTVIPDIDIVSVEKEITPVLLEEVLPENETIKDINLIITSPVKDANLYIGCKYSISISSSSIINSIGMSLYDFGTRKVQGPIASGISKDITGKDIKSIEWKVGNIWPGKYFISTSTVNGLDLSKKSSGFNINKIPQDISKDKIEEFCIKSN